MRWLFGVLCVLSAIPAHADEINVAAASDLNFAIKEIIPQFERETGHKVRLTMGSSGNFYAQIVNGAPFDVFLSADITYPLQLEKGGRAVATVRRPGVLPFVARWTVEGWSGGVHGLMRQGF